MKPTRVFEIVDSLVNGNSKYAEIIVNRRPGDIEFWRFDGTPKLDRWLIQSPKIEILYKRRKLPDLACCLPGSIAAIHPINLDVVRILEEVGELLPAVSIDGVEMSIINLTPASACLDVEHTQGDRFSDGSLMYAERFSFFNEKLPDRSLFKPVNYTKIVLALDRDDIPPERNFKAVVEAAGLTGIEFREIWNSVDGAVGRRGEL